MGQLLGKIGPLSIPASGHTVCSYEKTNRLDNFYANDIDDNLGKANKIKLTPYIWCTLKVYQANKYFRGSGCGSVGRAVASDTRGPSAKIYLYWTFVYCQLCIEKTKIKKKRPGMAHLKKSILGLKWWFSAVGSTWRNPLRRIHSLCR